jgi:eukaryotic-like serine/threonine-protein kinase
VTGRATHARLTELFAEAIALTPDGRASLLARLRASDTALATELAALLAADAEADTALGTGGLVPTVADRPGAARAAMLEIPGYRVLEVLGEGGMGTVYAAEQDAPRRRVAIKVLHARSTGALARFRTEAEIMARLDHPGIARVLEAGDAGGQPFLVMEYVDGVTLGRYVRTVDRARRLALFAALCDAVHHAHVKGVIHRDLKPSNVMVRPGDRLVVLDFGIARLAAADGSTTGDTRAGELIGTPLYMSPEQARLRPDEVDARSDVYTLGVLLYELACDELPYEVRGLPLPALTGVICEDEPRPLGKHDPALRGDLEAITGKALRKQPTERYQSAAALGDDVRRFLAGLPVSVRTPGALEQLRRFVRRRPWIALAIGAALAATAVFAIVVTSFWLAARTARATAEAAQHRAERARAELEVRTNELTLRQARAALARDPTEAVAWLATLVAPGPASSQALDAGAAWGIADEALGRGVASHVLRGHTDEVHWVEPVPEGADFVTGGYDGRVLLWQAPAYQPRTVFRARRGRVHLARPSPDGTMLAVGADDGQLDIVTRDGRVLADLPGHAGDVQHMAWSPDGAWLVTGDDHGNVWLWPHGREPGRRLASSTVAIGTLAVSADSTTGVGGDHLGALWLWKLDTGVSFTVQLGVDVTDTWTDGRRVVAVDTSGTVRTWHLDGAALVLDRTVATGLPTKRAIFAAGGAWVVLGGVGGNATRVEGDTIETIATHRAQVRYLAITDDGRRIATASDDGLLQIIDRTSGRHLTLRGHAARIRHLAFAGGVLLSSDGEGVVRRWDLGAMPPSVLDGSGAPVDRLAVSADGTRLASIDTAGEVVLWTLGDRAHPAAGDGGRLSLGRIDGHGSAIAIAGRGGSTGDGGLDGAAGGAAARSPTAITGTTEGVLTWWRTQPLRRTVAGIIQAIASSGDRVAVATSKGPIEIYTLDGDPVRQLPGNTGGTEVVAFDPRGALLASGGQDRVIRVYRTQADTFTQTATLLGPTGDTHFLMFSRRGDRLIAAGNDGVVFAWSVAGETIDAASQTVLGKHTGAVSGIAASFDGRWFASGGRDNLVLRVPLGGGPAGSTAAALALDGAASAIAFDSAAGIQAVTRTGAVVHATAASVATVIDHGAHRGVAVPPDRLAVALDDGAIVLEALGPHTLDQLAGVLARATTYRLPASR